MLFLFLPIILPVSVRSILTHQSDDSICKHEYAYNYMYSQSYELAKVAQVVNNSVRLEVTIVGKSDAHIRLTPRRSDFVVSGDAYYEIVLGAGGNGYSSIRKKPRNYNDLDRRNTPNILSAYSPLVVAITVGKDRITVYNNNTGRTILSGIDGRVNYVKYVSFSAWDGVSVFFTFDCQKMSSSISASVAPKEEESLTAVDRWRRDYLSEYDPYAVPTNDSLLVRIGMTINYLSLDSKAGLLTTRGTFNISWFDPKLKWNPDDYDGLNEIYFETRSIWRPDFALLDSPRVEESPFTSNLMLVMNSGQVVWRPWGELVTRCRNDETNNWPRDRHDCAVSLALNAQSESIQLSPMNDKYEFPLDSINRHDLDVELTSINCETVTERQPTSASPITFAFKMNLKRRMSAFSVLFILPLTAITALAHCGLYLPPSSNARNFMHSVTLVVLAVYLMMQERILPPGRSVPLIMKLTSGAFMFTVIQLIYSTTISCLTQSRYPVPKKLVEFISAKWVNYILFCPMDIYDKFSNDAQEQTPEPSPSCESQWLCVARFFDKVVQISSLVFLCLLYIMLMAL